MGLVLDVGPVDVSEVIVCDKPPFHQPVLDGLGEVIGVPVHPEAFAWEDLHPDVYWVSEWRLPPGNDPGLKGHSVGVGGPFLIGPGRVEFPTPAWRLPRQVVGAGWQWQEDQKPGPASPDLFESRFLRPGNHQKLHRPDHLAILRPHGRGPFRMELIVCPAR